MLLGGFQKLTLIDYPGRIATTVFTVGCSFRCPFCHNPELVEARLLSLPEKGFGIEKEFFDFLKKRRGKLEGVCVTGGEPTIQEDIFEFMEKIKRLGYAVKLDTNGTRPDVLKKALRSGLVDFVAMDIKSRPERYPAVSGLGKLLGKGLLERVRASVEIVRNSGLDYEFRTTVVPGLHAEKDFQEIAKWLSGARAYYLQEYREKVILDPKLKKKTAGKFLDLEKIKKEIAGHFQKIDIRR